MPRARRNEEENVSGSICSVAWPKMKEPFTAACSLLVCAAVQVPGQEDSAPPQGEHFTAFAALAVK